MLKTEINSELENKLEAVWRLFCRSAMNCVETDDNSRNDHCHLLIYYSKLLVIYIKSYMDSGHTTASAISLAYHTLVEERILSRYKSSRHKAYQREVRLSDLIDAKNRAVYDSISIVSAANSQ